MVFQIHMQLIFIFTKDKVVCNFKLITDELKEYPEIDFKGFQKG